ncbi:hypothetical protein DFH08DRAFT_808946 [Mycena albidolilacea]|uniref:Uncharacterized protein n=1 Tax=Mycena albidolilacea TaxID=1033008 RepID=A0AAD7ERY2_9AGAR|nr:hypothetical protein DFH08DRAFT_808946 [Mycena albidolilacea]
MRSTQIALTALHPDLKLLPSKISVKLNFWLDSIQSSKLLCPFKYNNALASGNNQHLSKSDRNFRYRRDQRLAEEAHAREISNVERTARHRTRSTSPSPDTNLSAQDPTNTSSPSTPTISTPSDISLSPGPSPVRLPSLLPAFFTPKPPRTQASPRRPPSPETSSSENEMAPPKSVELFRGNCVAEKAHVWLRTLEGTWPYDTKEEEKLYQFEKGLHPGGQADEWWSELRAGEKSTWAALLAVFEKKWPKPKVTRRTMDVVIEELNTNVLHLHELGQYVKDEDGTSVLSHVGWAETTRKLLTELPKEDEAMMLRGNIRSTLPVAFRRLLNDTGLNTWEKWLMAVKNVPLDAIRDAIEDNLHRNPQPEHLTESFSNAHISSPRTVQTFTSP